MSDYYFVARRPDGGFIGSWSVEDIRSQHTAGLLDGSLFVAKTEGQSFRQYQISGRQANWITVRELLSQNPPYQSPSLVTEGSNSKSIDSPSRFDLDRPVPCLSGYFFGGAFSSILLMFGQAISVITCLGTPILLLSHLATLTEAEKQISTNVTYSALNNQEMIAKLGYARQMAMSAAIVAFFFSLTLFIVFKRANSLQSIANDQDSENRRIWLAISELRSSPRPQDKVDLKKVVPANPPEGT